MQDYINNTIDYCKECKQFLRYNDNKQATTSIHKAISNLIKYKNQLKNLVQEQEKETTESINRIPAEIQTELNRIQENGKTTPLETADIVKILKEVLSWTAEIDPDYKRCINNLLSSL